MSAAFPERPLTAEHSVGAWERLRRWEVSPRGQLAALGVLVLLLLPIALSFLGVAPWKRVTYPPASTRGWFEMVTGSVAMVLLLAQFLLGTRRRFAKRLPGEVGSWRAVHKITALAFTAAAVLHSRAGTGTNATSVLVGSIVALMVAAQVGHVAKAFLGEQRAGTSLDRAVNTEEGRVHRAGLFLHVTLAALVLGFAVFHAFSVVYF